MPRKKVEFEVLIKRHTILSGETDEEIQKEVQKMVDYNYYQNSDSCEAKITKIVDID